MITDNVKKIKSIYSKANENGVSLLSIMRKFKLYPVIERVTLEVYIQVVAYPS